jgi:hypothetical protein
VLLHRGGHRAAVGDPVAVAGREDARLEARALVLRQAVDEQALAFADAVLLAPEGDDGVVRHGPGSWAD